VQESSTVGTPVGLYLGNLAVADYVYLMFEEQLSAIKLTMLGSLINKDDAQLTAADGVQYWDGDSWANLTYTDETLDSAGDSSFSQTGLVYWNPPTDEEKTTLFGTVGYAYRLSVDAALSTPTDDDEVTVDIITGIPAQKDIDVYKFPAQYKNKLMLCGYVEGNQGNRIDYTADNAPDVVNGEDSSMDGFQSIYVGSVEEVTAAVQLYNRFGSNIFSTFVILKNNEVWLMTGDSPLDYKLFPISFRIGCPAPYTLTTAEVGFEIGEKVERNVSMWISHQGPVMFDGAVIHPLHGLENFFDPNESDVVNFDYLKDAQGWFDSTYQEWNILLPTGGSTTLNTWLVYNVRQRKWFTKDTGVNAPIYCGIPAIASTGEQVVYGGSSDGRLYHLETGTSWDGAAIDYTVTTGDFFPSGNQWDITNIRRLKLVIKKLQESDAQVDITFLQDTSTASATSFNFQDVTADIANSGTAGFAFTDVTASLANSGTAGFSWSTETSSGYSLGASEGLNRLVRKTLDLNQTAWAHAIKFDFSSSEAGKGFEPIMWGIQWQPVRKDIGDSSP
jgi:hypothetical protein